MVLKVEGLQGQIFISISRTKQTCVAPYINIYNNPLQPSADAVAASQGADWLQSACSEIRSCSEQVKSSSG